MSEPARFLVIAFSPAITAFVLFILVVLWKVTRRGRPASAPSVFLCFEPQDDLTPKELFWAIVWNFDVEPKQEIANGDQIEWATAIEEKGMARHFRWREEMETSA